MPTAAQTVKILNRFTNAVLFECEIPADLADAGTARQLGYAVKAALRARAYLARAYLARAYLAGANLADAYLAGANLADAYLAGANLAGANLAGANLADANLADAYLAGAYLAGANLAGANLADANLADAYLAGAYLAGANLADAYLAGANLAGAYLADAYLEGARNVPETNGSESSQGEPADRAERDRLRAIRFRERNPDVPVVENLDAKILGAIEAGSGKLDMARWHTCETTHCRAGWAVTLAGAPGKDLETKYGPHHAGIQIYRASTGRVPHFFASNEVAMADIRACAAQQVA